MSYTEESGFFPSSLTHFLGLYILHCIHLEYTKHLQYTLRQCVWYTVGAYNVIYTIQERKEGEKNHFPYFIYVYIRKLQEGKMEYSTLKIEIDSYNHGQEQSTHCKILLQVPLVGISWKYLGQG